MTHAGFVACHDCDLIQLRVALPRRGAALCARCGAVLYRQKGPTIERTLALTLAGAILFVVANTFPFLAFELQGQVTKTTLSTGVRELYGSGMPALAALVAATTILVPIIELGGLLAVLLPLQLNKKPRYLAKVFRWTRRLEPWSMMEVFMLGILVSVVKLGAMARIIPGLALWAFALMILVVAAASATLNADEVWERLDRPDAKAGA